MKTIKPLAIIVFFMAAVTPQVMAQYDYTDDLYYDNKITYEIGTAIGLMNCLTDIGGREGNGKYFVKDLNLNNTQATGSIFISAVYKYALAFRFETTWGSVKASDSDLEEVKNTTRGRYQRNLDFRSTIFEVAITTEIHPLYFKKFKRYAKLPRISPYLVGGIGLFKFNPQTQLNGVWVDLKPLSTEGQGFAEYPNRKPYNLTQISLPVGGGIKYKLSPSFNLSAEFLYRFLRTDYLDDVSTTYIDQSVFSNYFTGSDLAKALALNDRQAEINPSHVPQPGSIRGNHHNKDSYFTLNFKLAFVF